MNRFKIGRKGKTIIAGTLVLGMVAAVGIHSVFNSSADSYEAAKDRLIAKRNEFHASLSMNTDRDESEVVRAIVELKEDAVVDKVSAKEDISEYTTSLKNKEEKIIDNQESIIDKAEKITGNDVVNQSAYLVNSFSIDATREQMRKLAKLNGVEKVYEATIYKSTMTTAIEEGNALAQLQDENYGHTGEGIVIAIIDTGVNYEHQDMVLDDGAKTKFTKEEWQDKIDLLGYGSYHTEKVPFGFDYVENKNIALGEDSTHGYHVSGIASGNNDEISGVAPNAQLLGLRVLTDLGGTSDDIVKGIEDAVKLGADVINMSLGHDAATVTDEDYMQVAVEKASEEGIICAIAAGNVGTSTGYGDGSNILDMKDTSMVGSPAVAESCLAVASANNTHIDGEPVDGVVMSSFSSWGATNELGIKPEITAPGGNIKAAFTGTSDYEVLSGTSMATPYVAGAEAVMLQEIKDRGYDFKGKDLSAFLKASLMNTADPIVDNKLGTYYSVRQQGSGMVDVYGAVKNDVIVTYNDKAKVELGELTADTEVELTLTNYGKSDRTYRTSDAQLYTDYTSNGIVEQEDYIVDVYGLQEVEGAAIRFYTDKVEVKAGESVTVNATVELGDNYKDNSYIEGFIKLEGEGIETIGLPVLGFYGDFDAEPIMDKSVYEEGQSFLSTKDATFDSRTGLVEAKSGMTTDFLDNTAGDLLGTTVTKVMSDNESASVVTSLKNTNVGNNSCIYDLHKKKNHGNDEDIEEECWESEEDEYTPIEYNKIIEVVPNSMDMYFGEFVAEEEGYVTLAFDIVGYINININKCIDEYCPEDDEEYTYYEEIASESLYGVFSKEIKVEKGCKYRFHFDIVGGNHNEEHPSAGTLKITKTDGSNCYTYKTVYDGDKVAFSPNDDGIRDGVAPVATKLRNAKFVAIKVLDENGEEVRTIANSYDESKSTYYQLSEKMSAELFANRINMEVIQWDGRLYNTSTGEMEVAPEGQYYIQIEAQRTEDTEAQIITMPVKIDTTAPEVKHFEVIKKGEYTYASFKAEDDIAMSNFFYIDINKGYESNDFANAYANTQVDDEGNYVVNLGKLTKKDTITLMIEDEAGNSVFKTVTEADADIDADSDIPFGDFDDSDMEYGKCYQEELMEGLSINLRETDIGYICGAFNDEIYFEGEAPFGSTVTINGVEAETYSCEAERTQSIGYNVTIPYDASSKSIQCHIVVTDDEGKEIYNNTIETLVDAREPKVEVVDKDNVWSKLKRINNNMTAVRVDNVTYPYSFQVKLSDDVALDYDTVCTYYEELGAWFWNDEPFTEAVGSRGNSSSAMFDEEEIISDTDQEQQTDDELNIDYDIYDRMNFISETIYCEREDDLCTFTVFGPSDSCIEIQVGDYAGNSLFHKLYFCDTEEKMEQLASLYDHELYIDNVSSACISKDDLNEDGTYTVTGTIGAVPEYIKVCGKEAKIDADKLTYSADVEIVGGHTRIIVEMKVKDKIVTTGATLFYEDMELELSGIPEGKTNKETFTLKGKVTSYNNVTKISVNGDIIYNAIDVMSNALINKPYEKDFSADVKLKEGKNVINIMAENSKGIVEKRTFEVEYKK